MSAPDHQAFLQELERGRSYEIVVALRLLDEGFAVRVGSLDRAETPWEGERFHEETDVIVDERVPIEVKSRTCAFTCAGDFPYPTINICTVKRWSEREIKPWAFVFVSQPTGVMLALSGKSFPYWVVEESHDRRRGGWPTPTYRIPREYLRDFDVLIEALHEGLPTL